MMRIFETFKPKDQFLQQYVSYYYLDIADGADYVNEYVCYPHVNNTLSFYKSHVAEFGTQHTKLYYNSKAGPLQVFTPLRQNVLKISQYGPVYKIAIVFKPFGFNQFISPEFNINTLRSSPEFIFFENDTLKSIFNLNDPITITNVLDKALMALFKSVENGYIDKALAVLHEEENSNTIDQIASKKLGIGRKQLNRLFQQHLGISPQKYRSIVRFRQLMAYKLNTDCPNNLSSLSHQAHYTDQSHLIKACKQLTGLTPSQFFKDGKMIGSEDIFWNFNG